MSRDQISDRFATYSAALRAEGLGRPSLLVDLTQVQRNLAVLLEQMQGRALRLVVKSLPCPQLLAQLMQAADTQRLMCFHAPFLRQIVQHFPDADVWLGKPMPVAAARDFYARLAAPPQREPVWMIDTPERLAQYAELARDGRRLRIALELDVGLHRGGFAAAAPLCAALDALRAAPQLQLAGFMGYDAHAAKAPLGAFGRQRALRRAAARYRQWLDIARTHAPDLLSTALEFNGGGSPTAVLQPADAPVTEISLGSALLMPTDFDLPWLSALRPAAYIAAPVLKRLRGVRIPFLGRLSPGASTRDTVFTYGGRWMAQPAWPPELRQSQLYGLSSNQQFFDLPRRSALAVDDYAYFRPTQSEAVLLGFGDLAVLQADGALQRWPVLKETA